MDIIASITQIVMLLMVVVLTEGWISCIVEHVFLRNLVLPSFFLFMICLSEFVDEKEVKVVGMTDSYVNLHYRHFFVCKSVAKMGRFLLLFLCLKA
jgi:hypothetical protein